ncbi:hypothetical protein F2Q69_00059473 [Brassica cretica]|uniref:Uncharacterized protein n=1 Tax=Brassica cretica TaxID=69181 RepID=A0A8S9RME9_BRACR|nr:hypothetical protein F2Q69_00059473 [Brassica cretica]
MIHRPFPRLQARPCVGPEDFSVIAIRPGFFPSGWDGSHVMDPGPPEYHVVSRRAVDDQKLGCHVDPFSVHRENDFSGSLLDFSAEAYEWGDLSRQRVLLQPQVVVCGLEDNVTGASVVRQYSFHYAVRYSE